MATQRYSSPELLNTTYNTDVLAREALKRRVCRVTFKGTEYQGHVECKVRLVLDPQNLRMILSVGKQDEESPCGKLVFTAERNTFFMAMEKEGESDFDRIQEYVTKNPRLFKGFGAVTLYIIEVNSSPIETGEGWRLEGEDRDRWKTLCQEARRCSHMLVWKNWAPWDKDIEQVITCFSVFQSGITGNPASRENFQARETSGSSDGSEGRHSEPIRLQTMKAITPDKVIKTEQPDDFDNNFMRLKSRVCRPSPAALLPSLSLPSRPPTPEGLIIRMPPSESHEHQQRGSSFAVRSSCSSSPMRDLRSRSPGPGNSRDLRDHRSPSVRPVRESPSGRRSRSPTSVIHSYYRSRGIDPNDDMYQRVRELEDRARQAERNLLIAEMRIARFDHRTATYDLEEALRRLNQHRERHDEIINSE